MTRLPAPVLLPACLLLASGAARADLEPYSFLASETLVHESNVFRQESATPDWLSTTEFRGALDQQLGRGKLSGDIELDVNRYKQLHSLDNNGYSAQAQFDWSTVGDLSGSLGANSARKQYFYGLSGETPGTASRNMETDNHAFLRAQVGGESPWTVYGGFDANDRNYSDADFAPYDERQWSTNGGIRFHDNPDVSFGLDGRYIRGRYPHFSSDSADEFSMRIIDLTTSWHLSGNSSVDARVGYTARHDQMQPGDNYVNGGLNWTWSPPSHFKFVLGLSRDSDSDTAASSGGEVAELTGRSINNTASLNTTYEFSPKTSFVFNGQYTKRQYSDATLVVDDEDVTASGANRTLLLSLGVDYKMTRTATFNCGYTFEKRHSDASIQALTPGYTANSVQCAARLQLD